MARLLALAQLAALVLAVATFAPFAVSSNLAGARGRASKTADSGASAAVSETSRVQGVLSTSAIVVDPAKDTLVDTAAQLARALSYMKMDSSDRRGADITITLLPGDHVVPPGGLQLGAEHSPPPGHEVRWWGSGGRAAITSGTPVTGWVPAAGAGLPRGTYAAPVPEALKGMQVRHMWVNGQRASRTRAGFGDAFPGGVKLSVSADNTGYVTTRGPAPGPPPTPPSPPAPHPPPPPAPPPPTPPPPTPPPPPSPGPPGANCEADFGSDKPCCNQTSPTSVPADLQCPSTHPVCVGYVLGGCHHGCHHAHAGHCISNGSHTAVDLTVVKQGDVTPPPPWSNPEDVEFVYTQKFTEARCTVSSLRNESNGTSSTIEMKQPCFWNLINKPYQEIRGAPKYVDNVKEHFQRAEPGTFYWDRAQSRVFYLPRASDDVRNISAVVATEDTLVTIAAGLANHRFDAVKFEYATWLQPGQGAGYVEQQAAALNDCPAGVMSPATNCGKNDTYLLTPGNIVLNGARNISFVNSTFQHLGAFAVEARNGSQDISWQGCRFTDTSAGALSLGSISDRALNETDPRLWDRDMLVEDCEMTNMPVELTGAAAIFSGYVGNLTIRHNLLANQSYSGMNIGWGWGRTGSGRGNVQIIANRIENPTQHLCCDGGALYTLGPQPGSSIRDNYILHDANHPGGSSVCIYHDAGSGGWDDSNNVCDGNFNHGYGFNVSPTDGKFSCDGDCPSWDPSVPGNCSMSFHDNWMRSTEIDQIKHCTDDVHLFGNTILRPSDPFPPAAQAVVAAAGPRYYPSPLPNPHPPAPAPSPSPPHPTPSPPPSPAPGPTPPPPTPSGPRSGIAGCNTPTALRHSYCDPALTFEQRADALIAELSTDEKIDLLAPSKTPFCNVHTVGVPRIGVPQYTWLTEVNSNVQAGCRHQRGGPEQCPTTFIGPLGIAASFNRTSWYLKGDVISTEMRAFAPGSLSGFGPNINVLKDPRYGRNSELAGEDPTLAGEYAVAYLKGMQQWAGAGAGARIKMNAYVKHYTAYGVETNRFNFVNNVSQFTFWDSYLPQFEMAFREGSAAGAMCSYFAPNGESVCGNDWLLNGVIRSARGWNRSDAVIESDCSAVANMVTNGYASDGVDASAKALNAGMDLYGGTTDDLWHSGALSQAITESRTSVAKLDAAVKRTTLQKMRLGLFDPENASGVSNPWQKISAGEVNTTRAQLIALEAAHQGMVLLKNAKNGRGNDTTLPLKPGSKLAVIGPFATDPRLLFSDYAGDPMKNGYRGLPGWMPSISDGIAASNVGGVTTAVAGIPVAVRQTSDWNASSVAEALNAVQQAEATILTLGNSRAQEHEGIDRPDTLLDSNQTAFARQVFQAAKGAPVILVLVNGGALSIDELIAPAAAIVESFSPGQQGPVALGQLLFGAESAQFGWGKMPFTVYPANYTQTINLTSMSFSDPPGRSYRYYNGNPLFRFGEGLNSYTTFATTGCTASGMLHGAATAVNESQYHFSCTLTNTGNRAGAEVLQLYAAPSAALRAQLVAKHPVPTKQLVGFERVRLAPGGSTQVAFFVPAKRLGLTNADGDYVLYTGAYIMSFSTGATASNPDQTVQVNVTTEIIWRNIHPPS